VEERNYGIRRTSNKINKFLGGQVSSTSPFHGVCREMGSVSSDCDNCPSLVV
jgi:hypothetical protein